LKGAVLHSHAASCNIVTTLFEGYSEFTISHQEMIKGIDGHGYFDTLVIPIIENTAWEHELADSLGETIAKYPKACAVLVRRHGMYVWGNSWEQAKRHGECLHYLFDIAIKMRQLGYDFNTPPRPLRVLPSSCAYKHVILDIEGTTTPITFVKDVLFPYSSTEMHGFLASAWTQPNIIELVGQLQAQAKEDIAVNAGSDAATAFAAIALNGSADQCVAAATAYAQLCIQLDRKITPLKKIQGLIWELGYAQGKLKGALYDDVAPQLKQWASSPGVRVSIYSSGSKHAQQLLFANSTHGDLRSFLSNYFDTSVGQKNCVGSYKEILLTLGAANPAEVLFVTDVLAEALAASSAGMTAVISVRPGNVPISETHNFSTITSFDQI
jgi:methylthioribulose 1-phosphate dehydratase / enolase-phosphatase E1